MAKITSPLMSMNATGAYGKRIIYNTGPHGAIAKSWHHPTGPASDAQIIRRAGYAAICHDWHELAPDIKSDWCDIGDDLAISGFNAFMQDKLTNLAPPTPPSGTINLSGIYSPPNSNNVVIDL